MTDQTSLTNLLNSNVDWGIVILKDNFTDQQIWEAIQKSDKKQTAFIIDLRTFPRETVDELLKRLDNKFNNKKTTHRITKNKI